MSEPKTIVLLDAGTSSITVSWPSVPNASTYTLQYRSHADDDFTTLSEKLTSTQAKKNNLPTSKSPFHFRVSANSSDDEYPKWCTHNEPFYLLDEESEKNQMDTVKLNASQGNYAIVLNWSTSNSSTAVYEIQMRESLKGGSPWKTIASSLKSTSVKKKNLLPSVSYQFRVRPNVSGDSINKYPFSSPSDSATPIPLSLPMEQLFRNLSQKQILLPNLTTTHIHEAFPNKIVLLYASAHWCPPCRQFTPQLAQFYSQNSDSIEVVFLSCDHDEDEFEKYFKTMPWKAIPYDDSTREELLGRIQVKGIPRLVVLNSVTGGMLVENAVGQPMNVEQWKRGQK